MISSLIDELRQMADGQVTFRDAREVMLEAADTIWQLRDDLQRANAAVQDAEHDESVAWDRVRKAEAENAKLKQELEAVGTAAYLYGRNDLAAENAKLRELVRDMNKAAHMLCEAWEGSCSKEAEGMSLHAVCPIGDTSELCVFGKLYDRMRELGVVDG